MGVPNSAARVCKRQRIGKKEKGVGPAARFSETGLSPVISMETRILLETVPIWDVGGPKRAKNWRIFQPGMECKAINTTRDSSHFAHIFKVNLVLSIGNLESPLEKRWKFRLFSVPNRGLSSFFHFSGKFPNFFRLFQVQEKRPSLRFNPILCNLNPIPFQLSAFINRSLCRHAGNPIWNPVFSLLKPVQVWLAPLPPPLIAKACNCIKALTGIIRKSKRINTLNSRLHLFPGQGSPQLSLGFSEILGGQKRGSAANRFKIFKFFLIFWGTDGNRDCRLEFS